jgi:hypothetical protein
MLHLLGCGACYHTGSLGELVSPACMQQCKQVLLPSMLPQLYYVFMPVLLLLVSVGVHVCKLVCVLTREVDMRCLK